MAKTLLLLRHAKSSWDDPGLDDFDRPLAGRGLTAAPRMAQEMAEQGWLPDIALVSPAERTRQTWDLIAPRMPMDVETAFEPSLYEAPAADILAAIRKVPARRQTLLVVGHNPGLETLAAQLADAGSERDPLERMLRKFPTGAIARLTFDGDWPDCRPASMRLTHFRTPKDLI